ncbi:salicylate hydroxylase 1 [Ilyonectria destructans]|nr:salicylate hydroxylase 1 [Ilyonectria destructans]
MPQNQMKPFEVAIIGGGIAGITLAISLLKRNIPCAIYEKAHAFSQVGAGLGVSPNAQRAMIVCDPSVYSAFKKVVNGNMWESKKNIVFEFLDGMDATADATPLFNIKNSTGLQGCHRGQFVTELLQVLPSDVTRFNKQLESIEDHVGGRLRLFFQDGTVAEADAIIGCDGIKSKMREILVGQGDPSAKCSYTYKYAYRGMIPMDQAAEVLGEERALNATIWTGKGMHLLTYPVAHGTILNVETQLTLPTQKGDFLEDFKGFRPLVLKIIDNARNLDRWAIFDLGDHPVPTFAKGRMCIIGDAAHASSPHHGAGAALCIEDAAVLASLLAHEKVRTGTDIKAALAAFDRSRRKRAQWVVQKSRRGGDLYELQTEVGNNFEKMARELRETLPVIWEFSIEDAIGEALVDLEERLSGQN